MDARYVLQHVSVFFDERKKEGGYTIIYMGSFPVPL